MNWLFFAIASLILWGFWGVLGKMGCRTTEPNHYLPLILIGELIVAGIASIIFLRPSHFRIDSTDNLLVIASSIAYALGGLFYFLARGSCGVGSSRTDDSFQNHRGNCGICGSCTSFFVSVDYKNLCNS